MIKCYTAPVPTTRPRHTITETERISDALEAAERRWPGERRAGLLKRLIEAGHDAIGEEDRADRRRLTAAVEATSGSLDGVYPPGHLEEQRREWRE